MFNLRLQKEQQIAFAWHRLKYEIERIGRTYKAKIKLYQPDSMGGMIFAGLKDTKIKGIMIPKTTGNGDMWTSDAGRREEGTHSFVVAHDECEDIEFLEEIEDEELIYRVIKKENAGNLGLYYNIILKATPRHMVRYHGK